MIHNYDVTSPSPTIERACLALAGVLVNQLSVESALTLAEALAFLSDVEPPYPPLPAVIRPTDPVPALRGVMRDLDLAIEESDDVAEQLRCARARQLVSEALAIGT